MGKSSILPYPRLEHACQVHTAGVVPWPPGTRNHGYNCELLRLAKQPFPLDNTSLQGIACWHPSQHKMYCPGRNNVLLDKVHRTPAQVDSHVQYRKELELKCH